MKTNEFLTVDLSKDELTRINGGTVFGLGATALGMLPGGILLLPLAAAAYKGWTDYKE